MDESGRSFIKYLRFCKCGTLFETPYKWGRKCASCIDQDYLQRKNEVKIRNIEAEPGDDESG